MKLPEIEFTGKDALESYQASALWNAVKYLRKNSPYYSKILNNILGDFTDSDPLELSALPFTTKEDLQENGFDLLCVPKENIADWVTTSGTTGEPVSFGLTAADVERLGYNEALTYLRAGVQPGDVIQVTTTIDKRFMAGLAYMEGARKLGCPVVRMGPGAVGMQIDSIKRFSSSVLVAVPSFVRQLIGFAKRERADLNELTVKKIICIGEPVRTGDLRYNVLGEEITKAWNVDLYSTYASTEMSTAFSECNGFCGGHLNPELGLLEVLDENDRQVSNGQAGEIVFTSLGVEGMPLLRYRTGDIAVYLEGACSCGSISPRVGPIIGRKQQRVKYKGTTIYPGEIISLMLQHQGKIPYVIEIDSDEYGNDLLSIRIGISPEGKDQFKAWFQENLRVIPELICDDPGNIEKLRINADMRKPRQVIDLR